MRNRKNDTFQEEYIVILDYQKPDGFWVWGHREEVFVTVRHGIKEKNNHAEAEKIAKNKFPSGVIKNVIYC